MTTPYATTAELADFLPVGVVVSDAQRKLERASELLDSVITAAYDVDTVTDLPTDVDVAAALRDACCLQIEYWLEVGEEHDTAGMAGRKVSIGQLSIDRLPPEVAPRARRLLESQSLLRSGVSTTPAVEFFATESGS